MGGIIPYPTGIFRRVLRLPIYLHRMGLGSLVGLSKVMILTTRGRRSGQPRFTALEYRRHGSKLYVISGWGEHPHWYRNLLIDPRGTVQVGQKVLSVRGALVENPAEATRVLYMFRRALPPVYDMVLARMSSADTIDLNTLTRVSNEFTIVRLDVVPEPPVLPTVRADLLWVWPLLATLVGLLFGARWLRRSRIED